MEHLTDKEYAKLEGIRRSELWNIKRTPLHFKSALDSEPEDTASLTFGRACHKLILEPETFEDEYFILAKIDRRTSAGKQAYKEALEMAGDREIISEEDYAKIRKMKAAIEQHETASELLQGLHEMVIQWVDPETDEVCKVKADCVTNIGSKPYLVDYKTTTSCADGDFERSCRKYGYQFQAGMYTEGFDGMTFQHHGFAFVAQEKTEPYAVRVYWCDPDYIKTGKKQFHKLLKKYHECKEKDIWPGYDDTDLIDETYSL